MYQVQGPVGIVSGVAPQFVSAAALLWYDTYWMLPIPRADEILSAVKGIENEENQ